MQQKSDTRLSRVIVIMGVAGSGKSTVGRLLAEKLKYRYLEGDDYHSSEAKSMMASGVPLPDNLRDSWVETLCQTLQQCKVDNQSCVLSYSGLVARHRQMIREAGSAVFFFTFTVMSHYLPAGWLRARITSCHPQC